MVNFIQAANANIKITEDVSYLLNDALHVNTVFTATDAVTAGEAILRINLPHIGNHAELNWYNTAANYAATAAAKVKNTFSTKDGMNNITISLDAATAASQEYHIEGWVKTA